MLNVESIKEVQPYSAYLIVVDGSIDQISEVVSQVDLYAHEINSQPIDLIHGTQRVTRGSAGYEWNFSVPPSTFRVTVDLSLDNFKIYVFIKTRHGIEDSYAPDFTLQFREILVREPHESN